MIEETDQYIWVITEESSGIEDTDSRGGIDMGGLLYEETAPTKKTPSKLGVDTLKREMQKFLHAMTEIMEVADLPDTKIQLDEMQVSVEINGEGQISLFGVGGGKAGSKGAITLKFKRNR